MLTHIIQNSQTSIFLVDEPDIYLHADLQRQLVSILRDLGPDILIATHSVEMITEAESEEITVVNKKRSRGQRIRGPEGLSEVFRTLGSSANPILTQIAKTRRVLFVEGKDFQILSRFAKRLGKNRLASRADFGVVPLDGFNPERARNLRSGMETTLGTGIGAACLLDRDYRSAKECSAVLHALGDGYWLKSIHQAKEIENYLLVTTALDRCVERKIKERELRGGEVALFHPFASEALDDFASKVRVDVMSQHIARRKALEKGRHLDESTLTKEVVEEFETRWKDPELRKLTLPGKDALAFIGGVAQAKFKVTLTHTAVIDAMLVSEVPKDIMDILDGLESFSHRQAEP